MHQTVVRIETDECGAPLIAEVPPGARAARLASQFVVEPERGGRPAQLLCLRCDERIAVKAPRKELIAFIAAHEDCEVVAA
jgi:hypothetical protein